MINVQIVEAVGHILAKVVQIAGRNVDMALDGTAGRAWVRMS